jgi:hypothetical protein
VAAPVVYDRPPSENSSLRNCDQHGRLAGNSFGEAVVAI